MTTHTDVYRGEIEGYHTYRIPALVVTQKGTLLAFCEGRKYSERDQGKINILVRRSTDNGASWSPQYGDTRYNENIRLSRFPRAWIVQDAS
jgi:sialidase-1